MSEKPRARIRWLRSTKTAFGLGLVMLATTAAAMEPNGGYYQGLDILYPYAPVFCQENGGGPCFGMPGSLLFLPKSAPLPPVYKHCTWADGDDPNGKMDVGGGWAALTGEGWYQWEPRTITLYGRDTRVCYIEDRGKPRDIRNLPNE